MAKSAVERKRASRQKAKREAVMAAKPDAETFRAPFFQFFTEQTEGASNWFSILISPALEAPEITDDSDPKSLMGQLEGV